MSATAGYIYIRNWDRFQHYKGRQPVWIKDYRAQLDDDEYLLLSAVDRGVLHDLRLLAALAGDGRSSADPVSLGRRLNVPSRYIAKSLKSLSRAGFIEIRASKAASNLLANDATEVLTTLEPSARATHAAPRTLEKKVSPARRKQVEICQRLHQRELDDGQSPAEARATCEYEFRNDPAIVNLAIPYVPNGTHPPATVTPITIAAQLHHPTGTDDVPL